MYVMVNAEGGLEIGSKPRAGAVEYRGELPDRQYREAWRLVNGAVVLDPAVTSRLTAEAENAWVEEELRAADRALGIVQDGDTRARGTVTAWRAYRRALRDHVTAGQVTGSRPAAPG